MHIDRLLRIAQMALVLVLVSCAGTKSGPNQRTAPLLQGLGEATHPTSTQVPLAQQYFDQGLVLAFGFNHAEAARSFREAQKLDPSFAMAFWGEALVLGPNINDPMHDENVVPAYAASRAALARMDGATPRERAYIEALATRYVPDVETNRRERESLDRAYAEAMRWMARHHPEDLDAQVLFSEALMDTMPWDYWLPDGEPRPATRELLATLESVLADDPNHPGANHFYIHAVEAVRPQDGVPAADRLGGLVPGAGHLVHMPAHIYVRVGRYHDASLANERAIASDDSYVTQCHAQGLYPLAYMPHNHHFLWYSAAMEGRSARALEAARFVSDGVDAKQMRQPGMGTLQHFYAMPWFALVRFGRWDEILASTRPDDDLPYPLGVWHYARGMALARTGDLDGADDQLAALTQIVADPRLEEVTIWDINASRDILDVARMAVQGEIALERGRYDEALASLTAAAVREDALNYDEPPPWPAPMRQSLGAAFLAAGEPVAAERAYQKDLEKYPDNGWSLFGLVLALEAQGRNEEADAARRRFEAAWARADVTLESSRF